MIWIVNVLEGTILVRKIYENELKDLLELYLHLHEIGSRPAYEWINSSYLPKIWWRRPMISEYENSWRNYAIPNLALNPLDKFYGVFSWVSNNKHYSSINCKLRWHNGDIIKMLFSKLSNSVKYFFSRISVGVLTGQGKNHKQPESLYRKVRLRVFSVPDGNWDNP